MSKTLTKPASLGPTFRAARKGSGLSGRELALEAEVSHTTLSRWERGERPVSLTIYAHLTCALAHYMAGRWEPKH